MKYTIFFHLPIALISLAAYAACDEPTAGDESIALAQEQQDVEEFDGTDHGIDFVEDMSELRHEVTEEDELDDLATLAARQSEPGPYDLGTPTPDSTPALPGTVIEAIWTQGQPAVLLGSAYKNICFITGVGGDFTGAGDAVWTTVQGGQWYLYGKVSHSGGNRRITAWARCTAGAGYSNVTKWTFYDNYEKDLGKVQDRICGFTRIQGDFSDANAEVRILLDEPTGHWRLGGTWRDGMRADAACVYRSKPSAGPMASEEVSWNPELAGLHPAAMMLASKAKNCPLQSVTGALDSKDDFVGTDISKGMWYVSGTSENVAASARCVGPHELSIVPFLQYKVEVLVRPRLPGRRPGKQMIFEKL